MMVEKGNSPLEDPFNTLLMGILMGFTNSLWRVSGEGSGGVTRAFGEDLWKLMSKRADSLGVDMDLTNPDAAMEFFKKFIMGVYEATDDMDYNIDDETVEMTITNCRMHPYTDFLEANGVPRSAGCPIALVGIALMEDVTGDPYLIDSIESNEGKSKITLKKL